MQARQREENPENTNDEIDIKALVHSLLRYKKSIFLLILISLLVSLYIAYFKPNLYQTHALIKIDSGANKSSHSDLIPITIMTESNNIDDEIVVFKTLKIAQKALENLHLGTRYYLTKNFKQRELYKETPFIVTTASINKKAQGLTFHLTPLDKKKFKLEIHPSFKTNFFNFIRGLFKPIENEPLSYSEIHQFGEEINTSLFSFTIHKIHAFDTGSYSFTILPNSAMLGLVHGGISASLKTKYGTIIQLTFQDTVPLRAKEILEALTKAYVEENLELKTKSLKKKLSFVDKQLEAITKTMQGSTDKLQTYRSANIVIDPTSKVELTTQKLIELEGQLYTIHARIEVIDNILTYMNRHNRIEGIDMESAQKANPIVGNIVQKIQETQRKYKTLLVSFTTAHPEIRKITVELDTLKTSLRETLQSSLRELNKQKTSLTARIEKNKGTLQDLPKQEQELEQLTRNFMVNEKIYSFLLQKRAEIAIAESSIIANTRVIEAPALPWGFIKPKRKMIILMGLVLGLILGLAQAFVRNLLDDTLKRVEDIEHLTGIPLYASLPLHNSVSTRHYHEALRVFWSNLEFLQESNHSKMITFTSTISGEGKTFTTFQLANLISKNGKSVIILDLDMRKANIHHIYKLTNDAGMSTLLSGKHTLNNVLHKQVQKHLDIITSGPIPPNPIGLIMSDTLKTILSDLKGHYDYILIDTPPVGLVADAMKLMHMSDITFFLVKSDYSKKDFIHNINRLTQDHNINTGMILNGISMENEYGYGYGYGYEY
ncbi:MAG: polysaccharide biosynthesis tyrosine autokinase [Campylobacterota bacterium]|nr:polysaccharide biosynthesis tyrosine autokinase [Campylobacterota bacterium]